MFRSEKEHRVKKGTGILLAVGMAIWGGTACQSHSKNEEEANAKKSTEKVCYVYMQNRDTITITITPVDSLNFRGTMVYKLAEKDRNVGVLQGFRKGDTLLANYTFQSEGVSSVRQVAFKESDSTLVEGFGEIIQVKDTTKFQNTDSLNFDSKMVLQQTKCY